MKLSYLFHRTEEVFLDWRDQLVKNQNRRQLVRNFRRQIEEIESLLDVLDSFSDPTSHTGFQTNFKELFGIYCRQPSSIIRPTQIYVASNQLHQEKMMEKRPILSGCLLVLDGVFNYYDFEEQFLETSNDSTIPPDSILILDRSHQSFYWIHPNQLVSMETCPVTDEIHDWRWIEEVILTTAPQKISLETLPRALLQWISYHLISDIILNWFCNLTQVSHHAKADPELDRMLHKKLEPMTTPLSFSEYISLLMNLLSSQLTSFYEVFATDPAMLKVMDRFQFRDLDDMVLQLNNLDLRKIVSLE